MNGKVIYSVGNTNFNVKVHEMAPSQERDRSMTESLVRRFRSSHEVEIIATMPRQVENYPELDSLQWDEKELAVSEHRKNNKGWPVARTH